jgi:hypothetical protein
MNKRKNLSVLIFALIGISISVSAHDPKEHAKENKGPDCSAIKDMGNMQENDPVAMAMMKKCHKMLDKNIQQEGHANHQLQKNIKDDGEKNHDAKH